MNAEVSGQGTPFGCGRTTILILIPFISIIGAVIWRHRSVAR